MNRQFKIQISEKIKYWKCLLIVFVTMTISCQKETSIDFFEDNKYIVLGHTYKWHTDGSKIDERLEKIEFSNFAGVWLGGDICSETTRDSSTLNYLDDIFDL